MSARPIAVRARWWIAPLVLALGLLGLASSTLAQPVPIPVTYSGDFSTRARLTGKWFGLRDEMGKKGITFDADLLLTPQGVASGGTDEVAKFWGNSEYTLNVDTGKAGLWPGGFFRVYAMTGFGDTINKDSGALVPPNFAALVPDLDREATVLLDLSYLQFFSKYFGVVVGKLYTLGADDNEFAHGFHDNFMGTAFGVNPALALFPFSAYGGSLVILPWEGAVISAGVVDPSGRPTNNDITEAFQDGVLVSAEGRFTIKPFGLLGHQTVGFGWSNKEHASLSQDPSNVVRGILFERFPRLEDPGPILRRIIERFFPNLLTPTQPLSKKSDTWSVYYNFDQYLWHPGGDQTRGIGVFFRDAPFTWTKQIASSYGGTRNGMAVHWPKGIKARGELRSQWHHVIDIAPTILEAAGLPQPTTVNGIRQKPIEGVSLAYTFAEAKAPSRHTVQYFEIFGNRAIYKDGWLAGTVHRAGWEFKPRATFENDKWELYDTRNDFSLANDLAAKNPEKLKELQALFLEEAVKYSVLPLDDRLLERTNAAMVGRPDLMAGRTSLTLYSGMTGMSENVFINLKNKSHTITAEVEIPKNGANGVLLAQAGRFGGWSLYLNDGKPTYTYNWLSLQRYTVAASQPLAPGKATIRFEFAYDGGGLGKGGKATIFVNGKQVATGRIERTQCCFYSADEGTDVGADEGTPVTEAYKPPFKFTGKIARVTVELKEAKTAEHENAEQARKVSSLKKALSD